MKTGTGPPPAARGSIEASKAPFAPGALARSLTIFTAGLFLANAVALIDLAHRLGALRTSVKWQSAILGSLLIGLGLVAILMWARRRRPRQFERVEDRLLRLGPSLGRLRLVLFVLLLPILPILTMVVAVVAFEPLGLRVVSWWLLTILGGLLLGDGRGGTAFLLRLAFSGVALGIVLQVAGYLPEISTYPLSLGWSETSRYYNASLFFARSIYGEAVPPPVLHPSRYLMQAVPFIFGTLPLWVHRLWQVLLWIGVTLGFALTLARRVGIRSPLERAVLAGASYLFLMQGPVYYHLLVSAWLVLAIAAPQRPWRTLAAVVLASAWAGISRVNWMPVPAMLSIVVYVLERRTGGSRRDLLAYLLWPAVLALGGAASSLAANRGYVAVSGSPVTEFASSLTSDLLWYRLLPSATYPLGVLPAILLASAPAVALGVVWARQNRSRLHAIRWLAVGGALAVLFAGGVVVSAKIGGGANLHNLDAYLMLLLVVAVYAVCGPVAHENPSPPRAAGFPPWAFAVAVFVPIAFALSAAKPWPERDAAGARQTADRIAAQATRAAEKGQAVLFISERHLIAFEGLDIPLQPDYEKVYLMEMAMAGNPEYLGRFHADLEAHRFGLIVTEALRTRSQGSEYTFGEEHDVWAERVARPILKTYRMEESFGGLWLMVPR